MHPAGASLPGASWSPRGSGRGTVLQASEASWRAPADVGSVTSVLWAFFWLPSPGRAVRRGAEAGSERGEADAAGVQGRVPAPGAEPEGAAAGAVVQVNAVPGPRGGALDTRGWQPSSVLTVVSYGRERITGRCTAQSVTTTPLICSLFLLSCLVCGLLHLVLASVRLLGRQRVCVLDTRLVHVSMGWWVPGEGFVG